MFLIESNREAFRKSSKIMGVLLALTGSFGLLLTMHAYVKPSADIPRGLRILGFPRRTKKSK